jgi:glutamine synthetase
VSIADAATGENLFDEHRGGEPGAGSPGYSKLAYQFTAGVLQHAGAITAIVCPTVNSYKRLTPRGLMDEMSWAPVFRAYGHNNRTLACRLPMNRRCLELRQADSAANVYLASAIVLAAGLEGMVERRDPGPAVDFNTYDATPEQLAAAGVARLPRTLGEALDELERDHLAREVLGAELHRDFLALKRQEWEEYNLVVGEWEKRKYLHLL